MGSCKRCNRETGSGRSTCASCAVVEHRQRRKLIGVIRLGGKCSVCGYGKSHWALQFHHVNGDKDFTPATFSGSMKRWIAEVDKCVLVCANCHAKIHRIERLERSAKDAREKCEICGKHNRDWKRRRICPSCVSTSRRIRVKSLLVDEFGGTCAACGSTGEVFDFHHTDPNKDFTIARRVTHSFRDTLAEARKCIMVCRNCHAEIHHGIRDARGLPVKGYESVRASDVALEVVSDAGSGSRMNANGERPTKVRRTCPECGSEIVRGAKRCRPCFLKSRRRAERPDMTTLRAEIAEFGYEGTGRKYGVTGNAIKKWSRV